jgi:hypothetical protein
MGTRLITDRNTGQSKGFGYAEFATPEEVGFLHVMFVVNCTTLPDNIILEFSHLVNLGLGFTASGYLRQCHHFCDVLCCFPY